MNALNRYKIYPLGDSSAVIDLGNNIDERLNDKVISMRDWLRQHPFTGLKDIVNGYSSLTVLYDPFLIYNMYRPAPAVFEFVRARFHEAWNESPEASPVSGKEIEIPVCYDPVFGHDLKLMAAAKQMSTDELVSLHCSMTYRVFMIGFLPGFAYMGKLDRRLVMPRRSQPREQVEAGAVGIAGWQTGIYPLQSPGGWQIIGRTPVKMFDPAREQSSLLSAGDRVRFYSISREAFESWTTETN